VWKNGIVGGGKRFTEANLSPVRKMSLLLLTQVSCRHHLDQEELSLVCNPHTLTVVDVEMVVHFLFECQEYVEECYDVDRAVGHHSLRLGTRTIINYAYLDCL